MRVAKFEQTPFRLLRDGIPAAPFLQCLSDGCKGKSPVLVKEGLIALVPNNEHHRRERNGFLLEDGVLAVFNLPLLHENILVERTRRRPNLDALVSIEQSVCPLQGTHGNQIDFDVLAISRLGEFLDRPFEPALLFCAVRDSDFNLIAGAERTENAIARTCVFARRAEGRLVRKEIVGANSTTSDEKENKEFAEWSKFWSVSHVPC